MQPEVGYRFAIEFDYLQVAALLNKKLREHTHTGAYFKHRQLAVGVQRVSDALGDGQVGEEVLTQVFLGTHLVVEGHRTHLVGTLGTVGIASILIHCGVSGVVGILGVIGEIGVF